MNTTAVARRILLSGNGTVSTAEGMALAEQSALYMQSDHSIFRGNTASAAGAILIQNSDIIVNATTMIADNSAEDSYDTTLNIVMTTYPCHTETISLESHYCMRASYNTSH